MVRFLIKLSAIKFFARPDFLTNIHFAKCIDDLGNVTELVRGDNPPPPKKTEVSGLYDNMGFLGEKNNEDCTLYDKFRC